MEDSKIDEFEADKGRVSGWAWREGKDRKKYNSITIPEINKNKTITMHACKAFSVSMLWVQN